MKKYAITILCDDTDGTHYIDYVGKTFLTREEAEKSVKKSMQDELETLGDGYHINGNQIIIDDIAVSTYNIIELEDETDGVVYNVYDYSNGEVVASLLFKDYMDYDKRVEVQKKIYEIKNGLGEDWQYYEVFDELHKFYDFEELKVSEKSFEI